MSDTMLNKQQLAFFDTFGYLGLPGLLRDCADQVIAAFEQVWEERGGGHEGKEHDPTRRSALLPFPGRHPYLASLIDDPRIHDIAVSILGEDFNYTGGDGNLYVGDTNWHSDGFSNERLPSIKIAFYLDAMTRETGALRVIPGSHRVGDAYADAVQTQIMMPDRDAGSEVNWGIQGDQIPAVAFESVAGDVLVFNHNLKHGAFGGSQRRRMYTMNFCQRYPEARVGEFEEMISHEARFLTDTLYGPYMVSEASPERMVHLEQGLKYRRRLKERYAEFVTSGVESSRG